MFRRNARREAAGAAAFDNEHRDPPTGRGEDDASQVERHPRALELPTLALMIAASTVGAIIGIELITTLGVTPNTSIIGALAAMALARVPLAPFRRYRSVHVQNLVQTAISSATFGAANALILPIGVPYALGRPDLITPMAAGVAVTMVIDAYLLYRLYGSSIFPSSGAWPPGVAAAEVIRAGDERGRSALVLALGFGAGVVGTSLGVPASAFAIALIGNVAGLAMFGFGLLLRGYSHILFSLGVLADIAPGGDLAAAFIPQGMMIGAALIALAQISHRLWQTPSPGKSGESRTVRRTFIIGSIAFVAIAIFLAVAGGLPGQMPPSILIVFIVFAAFAAFVHELVVGLAAMHTGWFPASAIALVTLLFGILAGFPSTALILLVGFGMATGPAFADMGYDLRAGTILRSRHGPGFELAGRRQQFIAALVAFAVATGAAVLSWQDYFSRDLIPPIDRVFAAAITAGTSETTLHSLTIWAVPGALIQFLGGSRRQLGVLFATGLLLTSPIAGWTVLAGIAVKLLWKLGRATDDGGAMAVFAGGVIAGDALFSFAGSMRTSFSNGR